MSRIAQVSYDFTAINQYSPWIIHDYYEAPFNVTLAVYFGTGLSATLAVQYAVDDMGNGGSRVVSISQTTTTITVTDEGWSGGSNTHGLAIGDFVQLIGTPGGTVDGGYEVATVTSATVYTLTALVSQTLATQQAKVTSGRLFTHSQLTGLTARANSNYTFPVWASRLTSTAYTSSGYGYLVSMQGSAGS